MRKEVMVERDLLTVPETCEYLGVSRATLWRWRKDKTIVPAAITRGMVRFSRRALELWVSWGCPTMAERIKQLEEERERIGKELKVILDEAKKHPVEGHPEQFRPTPEEHSAMVPLMNNLSTIQFDLQCLHHEMESKPQVRARRAGKQKKT